MNRTPYSLITLMLCGAAAVHAQNLISNPGFENTNPGDYWQLWKADTTSAATYDAALSFPDTGAHEGTRYARVEVKAAAPENWHIQLQLPPDWIADSGASYELKFWARSDSSSSIHLGIQDGPDNNYTYRSGQDFTLAPEWAEQTLMYTSDRTGNGALRFNLYLGSSQATYGFDAFSLTKQATGIRAGAAAGAQAFQVSQGSGKLVLTLAEAAAGDWKAELLDLRGTVLATAADRSGNTLTLAQPRKSGLYLIRATTPKHSWVRKVSLAKNPLP
jgi:hypothetical protein